MRTSPLAGQGFNNLPYFEGRREFKIRTNGKNNICTGWIDPSLQAERLTNYPFDAISPDSTPYLPVDTDPDPAIPQVIYTTNESETFAV